VIGHVNEVLLILHFIGLALGFSVSFANIVMSGIIAKATPPEKAVLGRFPPLMSRVGTIGLTLLWITGVTMVYTKWGGFAALPWQFGVKIAAVAVLTATVTYILRTERLVRTGDASGLARIEAAGKVATISALIAVIFAVLTFN
jgi:hypothetical protein